MGATNKKAVRGTLYSACELVQGEKCEQLGDLRDYGANGIPDNELLRLEKMYKETCITPSHTKCEFRKAYLKI